VSLAKGSGNVHICFEETHEQLAGRGFTNCVIEIKSIYNQLIHLIPTNHFSNIFKNIKGFFFKYLWRIYYFQCFKQNFVAATREKDKHKRSQAQVLSRLELIEVIHWAAQNCTVQ
jgi:hypothetical protein